MFKRIRLVGWVGAVAVALWATPQVQAQVRSSFDLPSQPLAAALRAVGSQTSTNVLFDSPLVEGLEAPAVKARLTTDQVFQRVLAGTGLKHRFLDEKTVMVVAEGVGKVGERERTGGEGWKAAQEGAGASGGEKSSEGAPAEEQGTEGKLDEVVVTARRKEENNQSVPVAITALSQDYLRQNNINSIQDLQNFVPSLSSNGLGRNTMSVFIRGQGPAGGGNPTPGVITYLNEVPLPADRFAQSIAGPGLYYDLDNVQVLKGPQGTLFGGNTIGGAILFQSKRPSNEFGGHVEMAIGNHDNRQLDAALNAPLVADKLLVRLAVNGQQREGYTKSLGDPNHPNGQDLDNIDYWATRATVTFKPMEGLQNDLIFNHIDYRSHGTSEIINNFISTGLFVTRFPNASPSPAQLFAQQQALGVRTQLPLSVDPTNKDALTIVSDILRYDLTENISIRNIFGYVRLNRAQAEDRDGTPLPMFDLRTAASHSKQYTEELQLQGNSAGEKLTWVVGAFFLKSPAQNYDTTAATVFGISDLILGAARQEIESKAGYSQVTYDMSSWISGLKVTGGLRYTWDNSWTETLSGACALNLNPDPSCATRNAPSSEALTWNASLDYQVRPDTLLYLYPRLQSLIQMP